MFWEIFIFILFYYACGIAYRYTCIYLDARIVSNSIKKQQDKINEQLMQSIPAAGSGFMQ